MASFVRLARDLTFLPVRREAWDSTRVSGKRVNAVLVRPATLARISTPPHPPPPASRDISAKEELLRANPAKTLMVRKKLDN